MILKTFRKNVQINELIVPVTCTVYVTGEYEKYPCWATFLLSVDAYGFIGESYGTAKGFDIRKLSEIADMIIDKNDLMDYAIEDLKRNLANG